MNFPEDHIACDQARVLGGLERLRPQDDYSILDFEQPDILFLSRGLAGPGEVTHLIVVERAGELDPLTTVRMRFDNVIRRL